MVALVAPSIASELVAGTSPALVWLDIGLGVLACVAFILAQERRTVLVAALLLALTAVSWAVIPPASALLLTVALRRRTQTAVALVTLGVAAQAVLDLLRPVHGLDLGWHLVLAAACGAALVGWGRAVQARSGLLAALRERARRAEEDQHLRVAEARHSERTRIAREMHDVLAHRLSLLSTYAGALEFRPDARPEQVAHAAGVVREIAHRALEDLREVIGVLRTDDDRDERQERPQPSLGDISRLVAEARAAGMVVTMTDTVSDPSSVSPVTGRAAYRIVQEGLTNALKHAAGQPVDVRVAGGPDEALHIVLDNPLNPGGTATLPGSGTGLVGLAERAQLASGTVEHMARDGRFTLRARLPWTA